MEELQSTVVVDHEILDGAFKRVQRILRNTTDALEESAASWEKKLKDAVDEARRNYAEKTARDRNDTMKRLPLAEKRIYIKKVEALLYSSMQAYLTALPRNQLLGLIERELRLRAGAITGKHKWQTACRALSSEELKAIMNSVFPGTVWTVKKNFVFRNLPGAFPAIVVDTDEARVTASIDALAQSMLLDKRAELTGALLGKGAVDAH